MNDLKKKYFAASNSSDGFKSYFEKVFEPQKYYGTYIIKGGPGTGKSYFMKRVGERAEDMGFSVTYIYCSSDPNSLDGIIIEEMGVSFLDGTAPHAIEATLPGAAEEIINLGKFLNTSMLKRSRRIIEGLSKQKAECFERAYNYLSAYKSISENIEKLIAPSIKLEKLERFLNRFISDDVAGRGEETPFLFDSVGMSGRVAFDTYYDCAGIYYGINDNFESAHVMLSMLYSKLKSKMADMQVSYDPILSQRLNALCVLPGRLTFEVIRKEREGGRTINMKRFIDAQKASEIRSDYRIATRQRDNLEELALGELAKLKKYHFTLEEIYGAAMDFSAKEAFCEEFCNKIFASC